MHMIICYMYTVLIACLLPPVGSYVHRLGVCVCLAFVCLLPTLESYLLQQESGSLWSKFYDLRVIQMTLRVNVQS